MRDGEPTLDDWHVYGDALIERGDPRGEVVALALSAERAEVDEERERLERRLATLSRHRLAASKGYLRKKGSAMRSKARFLGHSVHQMLVVFPLGLLATAVVFDIIHLVGVCEIMAAVAFWMMAGLVGALLAAPFGLIDWMHIPHGTRAKRIGAMHGGGNVLVLLLFAASWFSRDTGYAPSVGDMVWSFAGAALALVTAWLGGELVDRLGIGVDDDANVNAPNSLSRRREAHVK